MGFPIYGNDIDELGIKSRKIEEDARKAALAEYDKQKKAEAKAAATTPAPAKPAAKKGGKK